ncbi:MAG: Stp1/IreP family PP2C-type Ser/Thr phosphatase [Clostridiales bacterium]|nr:Stp1/IreP family PP2C-type Ser/Thr phosphatase [Clostridiales bacterium]
MGITDTGKKRNNNEDSYFVSPDAIGTLPNLLIVSDGMGGHNAGEIASKKAIEFFLEFIRRETVSDNNILDFIVSAVKYANENVYKAAQNDQSLSGMGATFSSCVVSDNKLYIAHIGDSRVYFVTRSEIKQITDDHSYVAELVKAKIITEIQAQVHPRKNLLTRVLGVDPAENVDGIVFEIEEDGIVLICSDGLTNMLSDNTILVTLCEERDLGYKARKLVDSANKNGGFDNISVVLADVRR